MSEQGRKLAHKLGVVPKLRLAVREVVPGEKDKSGNPKVVLKLTGPHHVKFVSEPVLIFGADPDTGEKRQEQKFIVEENGQQYRWQWPIIGKNGQPSYLVERTMEIEVGDERILEMLRRGTRNYIDIRKVDEAPDEEMPIDDDEGLPSIHEGMTLEEQEEEIAKADAKKVPF